MWDFEIGRTLGIVLRTWPFVLLRIVIPIPLPIPALWMLGVWIATQIFYVLIGSTEPVAWWAHLGGVIAGALLVLPLKRPEVALFGGR